MGVFANVYIGNKFSGTLEIKSNITGKKESYKIIGFSRIFKVMKKLTDLRNIAYGHADAALITNEHYDVYKQAR
jgi:hypothetical protein